MFGTPRSASQRRQISEDRTKLDELRYKNKIRDETYKIEIDKLRQKLDKIRYKFERQNTNRQNSQEMQRLKEENLFLKSQFQFQKQQIQQSFQVGNILQSQRETSAAKRAYSSRSTYEKHQNQNYQSGINSIKEANYDTSNKKVNASDMELVKIAQHKLMKENKNLKKRVDIMQSQMRELYELIFDEKAENQQLQKSSNYHQLKETLKNYSNESESSNTFHSQLNDQVSNYQPIEQNELQNKQFQFNEQDIKGYKDASNNFQNEQNIINREYSDQQKNNQIEENKVLDSSSKLADSNMKFNISTISNNKISRNESIPFQEQNFEIQDVQLNGFQEKIELTKSKFIDKIKNVFSKHQKQNEIFENNNKQIKEITNQLLKTKKKNNHSEYQFEKETICKIGSSTSSITSSASSACIIEKSSNNDKIQYNIQDQNDFSSNDDSITDDGNKNDNLKQYINYNEQNQQQTHLSRGQIYSSSAEGQMNFQKKQYNKQEEEQMSTDIDFIKKQNIENQQDQDDNQKSQLSNLQNEVIYNKNHSNEFKQQAYLNSNMNPKQIQNEINMVKLNDTYTKKENSKKSEVFFSPKEQFSTLLNKNINNNENTIKNSFSNNSKSNLNETTGLSSIINNYLSHTGYVQELPTRRFDPLTQLQVIKNYPSVQYPISQYPTSSTMTNCNRQYSNSNNPSQQFSITSNLNYLNSIELKNQDNSSNCQTQSFLEKFNQTLPNRKIESYRNRNPFELDYKNKNAFELQNIGNSTKTIPQKDLNITSRLRDELYLNIPSSTQSQSLHQQGQKKNLGNSSAPHKNYESKLDQLSKAAQLTTPLIPTQREKINDEYIKQIIQSYKTPKKISISSQLQAFQPQQIYQPIQPQNSQQFKKQNEQYQNLERNEHSQPSSYTKSQTKRLYEKDSLSNNQYQNNNQNILNGATQFTGYTQSNTYTQSSPNKYQNNKISISSQIPISNNSIKSNNFVSQSNNLHAQYSKDLTIYNCYFNNNSPLQKKIANIQPPLTGASTAQSSYTNREALNLNHKRQQSCGNTGASGINKHSLKLNLTSLISPKSSQIYQSDRQISDRTGNNRQLSKNSEMVSSNISPKYSPHSSQVVSVNHFYQK